MRVTVTLDADVDRLLRDAARERGASLSAMLNEAVRRGLGTRFVQNTYDMGFNAEFRWDKALAMVDALEGEEIVRKMSLSK
jgi:hypothetical protein